MARTKRESEAIPRVAGQHAVDPMEDWDRVRSQMMKQQLPADGLRTSQGQLTR